MLKRLHSVSKVNRSSQLSNSFKVKETQDCVVHKLKFKAEACCFYTPKRH